MSDSKKKSEDWDFKVSEEHLEQVQMKKKPRKASGGAGKIAPGELKKTKKKKKLEVETVQRKKMSRSAIAKRDAALENYAQLMPPSFMARLISTVIDYGIIGGLGVGAFLLKDTLHYHYVKVLADNGISQTLDPILLDNLLMAAFVVVTSFLIVFFPVMSFKKTPGKSIMNIRIGHATIGERPGKMALLLRELILKPISVATVLGVLIGLKNDGNRCLHDMILGTALYIDD
jgi:uncharacterized RDD family membrane protein YckC